MLTEVVLYTDPINPRTFKISDVDPTETLILEGISGLTPQDVTNFTGEFARSGGYYQGRRVGGRFPVFKFKLNPNYAEDIEVSDLREELYRLFYEPQEDSDRIPVVLKDDRRPDRILWVYAEKWDGDIFEQSNKAAISTQSVDAHILSLNPTSDSNAGGWLSVPITYDGSADVGLVVNATVIANTSSASVDVNGQTMTFTGPFVAGDEIQFSSVDGGRYVQLNGDDAMVMLAPGSEWIQLKKADNTLRAYGTAIGDGKMVINYYEFRSAWRGV